MLLVYILLSNEFIIKNITSNHSFLLITLI